MSEDMQIKILNFGPIKKFEFDLSKDLIVTYGINNIGKSYAITVVYLLLKHLLGIQPMHIGEFIRHAVTDEKLKNLEARIDKDSERDITNEINNMCGLTLQALFLNNLEDSFKNTFGPFEDLKNHRSGRTPILQLNIFNHSIHLGIGKTIRVKRFSLDKPVFFHPSTNNHLYQYDEVRYTLFINAPGNDNGAKIEGLRIFITDRVQELLEKIQDEIEDLYFLPASRSGLYTGSASFFPIFAELSKKRTHIQQKIELPAMSEPIADYILRLSEINGRTTTKKAFRDIAGHLEKKILKGEIGFDPVKKRLTYSPEYSHLVLDMSSVSSMVSELSPIVAFIKYLLVRGEATPVIFIEEPEAHLHPEAQVKLVEVFVKLVKAGVKLIITSHSNYIFNKLNNLVIKKDLSIDCYSPIILKETEKGSISHVMAADDLGVEDENFLETADTLYEERELILDTLNNQLDDQ